MAPNDAPKPAIRPAAGQAIWRVSFALAIVALAVFVALRLIGFELARSGHSADASLQEIVIGNDVLTVPGNLIRFESQRRSGTLERLDLHMHWPGLSGYEEELRQAFDSAQVDPSILFLTIEPRQMALDMGARIGPLYSKFFDGPERGAVAGLRKRRLKAESGFPGEDLYYEVGKPHPFAARCIRVEAHPATPYCLRDIHIGRGLAVTYRFHLSLIRNWMALDTAIRARVAAMLTD